MQSGKELFVQRINAKDKLAYEELFVDFYATLAYYSSSYVLRQDIAEDIVQDAFGRFWESDPKFETYGNIVSYLYLTVRNISLDWLKHKKVEKRYADSIQLEQTRDDELEYGVLKEEVFRTLFKVVEELPPRCREVFRLYMQGNNGPQIAEALNISVDTVRTHRKQALKVIRERMGHMYLLAVIFDFF